MFSHPRAGRVFALLSVVLSSSAQTLTMEEAIEEMQPYTGEHVPGVDTTTLTGKVMCGYQGWFGAEGDAIGRGWVHYGGADFGPGRCTIDLWPEVAELEDDEKYRTPFLHADGSIAHVYSPGNRKTVERHFKWMQDYGIDGVFLQRFAVELKHPATLHHRTLVTANVQAGANRYGRTWAMMYDLSGLRAGLMEERVQEDWKRLVDRTKVREDQAYLHHKGKPVVAVWGVGFSDDREYTLEETRDLVDFLKNDPVYGGNTVMLGVPTYWREQKGDAVEEPLLHEIIGMADIVSPWLVGRYTTPPEARKNIRRMAEDDRAWCQERGLDYMRVIFPGFSWHNLMQTRGKDQDLDAVPRLGGDFLWSQAVANKRARADMLYVAMFDELDEGTAIFKVSNDPPVGESPFVAEKDVPSDQYLWLTGEIGKLLRGERRDTYILPTRKHE
ncbi:MAG: xylosidase/arabinosidase [Candidatus Hydrogenedens sp.]|nr:xylosidase/arabinosidase [Candidatus Hydrogenedens sp.]